MKNVVRRPLKMIAAAMFMVALGYGVATNLEVSESGKTNDVTLSALGSVSAQGEENDTDTGTLYSNAEGTVYCCAAGTTRTCGAASCPW